VNDLIGHRADGEKCAIFERSSEVLPIEPVVPVRALDEDVQSECHSLFGLFQLVKEP
jgi:hypothetical protein